MKLIHLFLLVLALAFVDRPATAAAEEDPSHVAQVFYDGCIKVLNAKGDERRYVMKSDSLTPAFKKAYTAYMKEADSDPIIQGQDFPKTGFKASAAKLKDGSATVTMTSRDASFAHSFKVTLVNQKRWLISGIGDLQGK